MQCLNTAAKDMPEADKARRFHPGSSPHPATWSDVWRWAMNIYDGLFENLGEKNAIQWFIIIFPVKVVFLGAPTPPLFGEIYDRYVVQTWVATPQGSYQ